MKENVSSAKKDFASKEDTLCCRNEKGEIVQVMGRCLRSLGSDTSSSFLILGMSASENIFFLIKTIIFRSVAGSQQN